MSISWGTRISDYLVSLGLNATFAANASTYVDRMTTQFADVTEDPILITMLAANIRPLAEIGEATYGKGLDQANTLAYILANFPQYTSVATLYSNVIVTDINTNLVDTPAAEGYYSAANKYKLGIAAVLTAITKYMRHFTPSMERVGGLPA